MQAAKKAVETIKETAANIGASAKSGLEKTKATAQEKAERMSAHDPVQKEMATHKKEGKIQQAEREKQEAREHNAAAKQSATAGHMEQAHYSTSAPGSGPGSGPAAYSTAGDGQPMGATQMSAKTEHEDGNGPRLGQGHGIGHGELNDEVMGSRPIGINTGIGRTAAHSAQMGGTATRSGPDFS